MNEENPQKSFLTDRNFTWAKRSAVHFLGLYASSVDNLKNTLVKRAKRRFEGIPEHEAAEIAARTVKFCVDNGFLNDTSYAETKVVAGMRKGHSRRRIAADLAGKGVDLEIAHSALEETDDMISALTFARKRRFGPWRTKEADVKQRHKEAGAFARNGYSGEVTFKVIGLDLEEAEDILYLSIHRP